jgi:hypothetical protein
MVKNKSNVGVDRRIADSPVGRDRRIREDPTLAIKMRPVLDWLYITRWVPWIITLLIVAVLSIPDAYSEVRFFVRPVAIMQGDLVGKDKNSAFIHIYGKKVRGVECRFMGMQAFGDRVVGPPVDLELTRPTMHISGETKPEGPYDIGIWEVKPVLGVISVRIYTTHNCEGTIRPTKIAEVKI